MQDIHFAEVSQRGRHLAGCTAQPNVSFGSVAPDRHARDVAAMSASHPITTELVRHNEPALRATNGPMHCSNNRDYSITSSARASSVGGIAKPIALAVVRLITSSNLVGCSIGRSPGFAPRKILSTYSAARRNRSTMFAP